MSSFVHILCQITIVIVVLYLVDVLGVSLCCNWRFVEDESQKNIFSITFKVYNNKKMLANMQVTSKGNYVVCIAFYLRDL